MGAGTGIGRRRARPPAPRRAEEEVEIRTSDDVALRAVTREPERPAIGTAVLAHAMFARKSALERLADVWLEAGWRTIAFDFRGHGQSGAPPGRSFRYDDLVRIDLPAVVACARDRADGLPVVVVGHSLGAHVALAAQGAGRMSVDAVVAIAGAPWLRALEPSRARWALKVATARAALAVAGRLGSFPARALRVGSDDEPLDCLRDVLQGVTHDAWRSADGADDYLSALGRVSVPVCALSSEGDPVSPPRATEAFVRRCAGEVEAIRTAGRPGHAEIVTTDAARPEMARLAAWTRDATSARPYARP